MNLLDHVRVALDALRANPLRGFLNMLGVIIGVLSVILLVSVGDGLRGYLDETFGKLGSNLIEIRAGRAESGKGPPPLNTPRKLTWEDARALRRRSHLLEAFSPIVYGGGNVRRADRRRDVNVAGVGTQHMELRSLRLGVGRWFTPEDLDASRKVTVLGVTVVKDLFGDQNPLGQTIYITDTAFRVVGVIAPKGTTLGYDWDDVAYMPTTAALEHFNLEGVTQILCRSRDRHDTRPAIEELEAILKERHAGQLDFTVRAQDDMLATLNGILDTMSLVLLAIASISLLVGGIGIMNIMLVSVRERTREIGIRRAVGARRSDILLQFLVESVVISFMGGLVGLLVGLALIMVAGSMVPDLPLKLTANTVGVSLGFSALVGVFSGVVPARNAARQDVVEALRYE